MDSKLYRMDVVNGHIDRALKHMDCCEHVGYMCMDHAASYVIVPVDHVRSSRIADTQPTDSALFLASKAYVELAPSHPQMASTLVAVNVACTNSDPYIDLV